MLNASVPASVSFLDGRDIGTGNQTTIYGLAVRDYLAFFLTKAQFQVWNISTPGSISPWTASGTTTEFSDSNHALSFYGAGGAGTSLFCYGDYFYAAVTSSQGNNKDNITIITPGP